MTHRSRTFHRRPSRRVVSLVAILSAAATPASSPVAILPATSAQFGPIAYTDGPTAQRSDTIVIPMGAPLHLGIGVLVEDLVIGRNATADEYRFTRPPFVAAGRDGSIYVNDLARTMPTASAFVRKYDRNGLYVRTFGRIGQGPGEFRAYPTAVLELPDGRVLVLDSPFVHAYSAIGAPLGDWKPVQGSLQGFLSADPRGNIYVTTNLMDTTLPPTSQIMRQIWIRVRLRPDGTVVDSIPGRVTVFDWNKAPDPTFVAQDVAAFSPLGYWVTANTGTYAIDLRLPPSPGGEFSQWRPGDPITRIRRTVALPAVPLQTDELADWREYFVNMMRAMPKTPNWTWTGPDLPRIKAPISGIRVFDDGRIWVQLSQPAHRVDSVQPSRSRGGGPPRVSAPSRWPEPAVYDVIAPAGQYIGQVRLPDGLSNWVARGDTVWASTVDIDDVPVVKRFRIRWGG
jgi:hypothetical protein